MSPTLLKLTHANAAAAYEFKGRLFMCFRFQERSVFDKDNRARKYHSLVSPRNRQLKGIRAIISDKCLEQDPDTGE